MHDALMTMNTHQMRLALESCLDYGYGFARAGLFPETAGILTALAEKLEYRRVRMSEKSQSYGQYGYIDGQWPEEVAWLVEKTQDLVTARARAGLLRGLMAWQPNDVVLQTYDELDSESGWHKDFSSDLHIVVVFSLSGFAQMKVKTRQGAVHTLSLIPGSAVFLLAPDPDVGSDPRLAHKVGHPLTDEGRISLAVRMNVSETHRANQYYYASA